MGVKKNPTTQMSQKVYVTKSNERLDERRSIWTIHIPTGIEESQRLGVTLFFLYFKKVVVAVV